MKNSAQQGKLKSTFKGWKQSWENSSASILTLIMSHRGKISSDYCWTFFRVWARKSNTFKKRSGDDGYFTLNHPWETDTLLNIIPTHHDIPQRQYHCFPLYQGKNVWNISATEGNHNGEPQPIKVWTCSTQAQWSYCRREGEKPEEPKDQGVDCKIVSPSNTRACTHKDSPTWLSKYELIKITPMGRPNGVEKSPQGSSLNKEL